ncbi:MAG TPA: M36 family metallopeptidase [Terriglobia bacterium]|nr:M36 family metallopeptidase [Terriglobia bacterium]
MAKLKGVKAKTESHPIYKVPRRIYDIEAKASAKPPQQIAAAFLKRIAPDLKIDQNLSQLKFDKVKKTLLGSHVLYQQYLDRKPISGAWIRVDIDKDGKVYNVQNDLVPAPNLAKTKRAAPGGEGARLSKKDASAAALDAVKGRTKEVLDAELVYFPHAGVPTEAWKVIVKAEKPSGEWKVYVDAKTGALLECLNILKRADGKGRVFDPNPVVTLNDIELTDSGKVPNEAYVPVTLRGLKSGGVLDGPFVSTKATPNRIKRISRKFMFKRGDRAFKEVMVYFHIDRMQRHLQELGFQNVLNRPILVNIDGTTEDNSFYSPSTKNLTFGTGGVDDAEDAEIILHEYGHAIQDDQVPGFGAKHEGGSMGEGFGDFLAASFFSDKKPAKMKPTLGNWDAVSYSGDDPPSLRRLDSNKKYPKDMNGEVHDDGEIWSACLWELRSALGRRTTEHLVIAHHFLLTRNAEFEDAANALILADKNLNQGANEAAIRGVFVRRGILPNPKRKNRRAGEPFEEVAVRAGRRVP